MENRKMRISKNLQVKITSSIDHSEELTEKKNEDEALKESPINESYINFIKIRAQI